jgi:serine/threonine-protein kinase
MTSDSLQGRTINGYRLLKQMGEGGTALVYRAEHPERGTTAVKVLRHRLAEDPVAVKRFLSEADLGKRVTHPNIVKTFDYGQSDGLYYLALEWIEGEPLANFATRSGPLAPAVVATIVEQIGGALAAAHKGRIIHRDLKPANIMFDPATQRATLLDFGIARDTESNPDERLTRAGFFVGTLQYVAPETLSGALVNEQADVYSLATIAYYLLTGEHPFNGKNPRELFQQLLTQDPVPLSQATKGLRFAPAIEAAVMQGLMRDLSQRTKTVDEFATAFCTAVRATEDPAKGGGFLKKLFGR